MRGREDIEWELFRAVEKRDVDRVRYLLAHGAPVDGRGGGTIVLRVAAEHGNERIVRLLVERGAQPDLSGEDCWTPLQAAISHGHIGIARFLLANGANPNVSLWDGWTPLHTAAGSGNEEMTKLLLAHGADALAPNEKGQTPLDRAVDNDHKTIARLLESSKRIDSKSYAGKRELPKMTRELHNKDDGDQEDEFRLGYRDKVEDKVYERSVQAKTDIAYGWVAVGICLGIGLLLALLWEPLFLIGVCFASFIGGPRLISGYINQYRYRKD